jgi:hypothetical protein
MDISASVKDTSGTIIGITETLVSVMAVVSSLEFLAPALPLMLSPLSISLLSIMFS